MRQLVVISDLHAHPWAAFARGDGIRNTRLQQSLAVLRASLQKARDLHCPWVFGGDIVHTAGYGLNVVLSSLIRVLEDYPDVEKLIVWGNHDARGVGGRITLEQTVLGTLVHAVEGLKVLDPTCTMLTRVANGLTFSGAGYQPSPELLDYAQPSDVGVYHQTVRGSMAPNGFPLPEGIDPAELHSRHKLSIVGHVHHPQQVDAPGVKAILIPGSPEHQTFGDVETHGWWILTMREVGPPLAEFVPSGSPEFLTVETPADVRPDGNYYRVRTNPAGVALPPGVMVVAPTPTTIQSRGILRGVSGDGILTAWMAHEPPAGLDPARVVAEGRQLLAAQDPGTLRPIQLTQVDLTNFCSYADASFPVRAGTWLVLGQGRDYPSNGAGKSTLFEAVFWLLFGRTTKGLTGDEVIRWGADVARVRGTFEFADGGSLVVTRCRGDGSDLIVEDASGVWEAPSVTAMTEKLTRFLGLTPELFQALGYFSQERMLLFASASDGERKEMLADLIGLAAYQEASAAAQTLLTATERLRAGEEAIIGVTQQHLQAERDRFITYRDARMAWDAARHARLLDARYAQEQFARDLPAQQAQLLTAARAELTTHLHAREQGHIARLAELAAQLEVPHVTYPLAAAAAAGEAFLEVNRQLHTVLAEQRTEERVRRELVTERDRQLAVLAEGKCPTCGQAITPTRRDAILAPLEQRIDEAETRRIELAAQQGVLLTKAADAKRRFEEIEAGVKRAAALDVTRAQVAETQALLAACATERADLEQRADAHVTAVLQKAGWDLAAAVKAIEAEVNPHATAEAAGTERITAYEQTLADHASALERYRDAAAIAQYWQHGFSKQGIQSLLVDEIATLFNAARGRIFPALTQGIYDVQFSTQSQTKGGETRERTAFQVYERGEPVPYAALSGGQRRRIDVGVMLTLVVAVAQWLQVPGVLGMLVLDEVFGFLDASGAEGLVEALRDVQQVVPAVYVITHDAELQALFPESILVTQDAAGISHLAMEEA